MDNWQKVGMPSNRAEMLSVAVRANMRKKKDLPIAMALQPVAATAWAVVDGLADEADLFAAALEAQKAIALRVGAFPERGLLDQVMSDCAPGGPDEQEPTGEVEEAAQQEVA
jgi:hypothetical protein